MALVRAGSFIRVPCTVNNIVPAEGQQFSKPALAATDTLTAAAGRPAAQRILSVSARRLSWDAPAPNGATRRAAITIFVRFRIVFDCELCTFLEPYYPTKTHEFLVHLLHCCLAASGNPAVTECRGGDCVNGEFNGESVWCDNKNNGASTPTCQSSTFRNNRVECEAGSCKTSSFLNSEVRCLDTIGENSCDQSIFNQSSVLCYDGACQSSDFYSSAIYCDPYLACSSSISFACSCCDVSQDNTLLHVL